MYVTFVICFLRPPLAKINNAVSEISTNAASSWRLDLHDMGIYEVRFLRSAVMRLPRSAIMELPRSAVMELPRSVVMELPRSAVMELPRSRAMWLPRSTTMRLL
jgi:hypothetical protein